MKKSNYFLILLYTFFVLFIIFHYIFNIFDFTWQELFNDLELLQSFVFFVVIIGLSLTILIVIAARLIQYLSVAHVQKNLRSLLDGDWSRQTNPSWIALCISSREGCIV